MTSKRFETLSRVDDQGLTISQNAETHIRRVLREPVKEKGDISLFSHIVHESGMPKSELTEDRLAKEAQAMLGGGTVSPARTMSFASYYILSRPDLKARLQAELADTMAEWPQRVPTWEQLESLPLLQAIIKESLR